MLKYVDTTEDRDFQEGETIYDVDDNAYIVKNNLAILKVNPNEERGYYLGPTMKLCFSRNR